MTTTFVAMLALAAAPASSWADDDDDDDDDDGRCMSAAVESLDFVEMGVTGKSRLCVQKDGIRGRMMTRNLTPGNAYTIWWVYIDQAADACGGGGFFDCVGTFFGEDPLAVFGRMDSAVANYKGRSRYANKLDDLIPNSGSQVWMLQFGHGPASSDGRQRARQLLTPEDPASGAPHLGVEMNGYPTSVAIYNIP